ncbi:hypothetical protein [Rhodopirellula bahusiensis]|uniref:hypothetical protein n=2 Tax=Rhodopirellula bahusiensis TaxID=2014065 RepID=UPI003265FF54
MDADKIKQFFILHGEKFVVGIVVLAAAWMVYAGLQMPNMLDEVQPERLTTDANTVRNSIDDDHNENILPEREPVFDILAETARKRTPVDSTAYKMPHLLERKTIDTSIRRTDPVIHAPLELRVDSHIASIAMLSSSGDYALKDLEGAEALEVVEKEKPRPTRRGRRGAMNGMGDMEGMGMDGMGMDGMGMDMGMYGADMGMGMEMGMMGGGMGTMSATAAGRRFDPKHNFGFAAIPKDSMKPVPQYAWFISGTAVIPHKAMAESFRKAFREADGYLPIRDQPLYFNYEVQRADVTSKGVDELTDEDWIVRYTREQNVLEAAKIWAGYATEVVPEEYRDMNVTAYIPPILLADYKKFVTHPLIPMVSRREEQMKAREEMMQEEQFGVDDLELAGPGATGMAGMGGMDMGMDMGMSSMDMGMGMGGMGAYGGMAIVEEDPVEYKLMRFYDFASNRDKNTPLPGRKYVYRIRLAVVDPNFPANALQQPKVASLSGEVYQRVSKLMEAAETDKSRKGHFQRWSDWSDPSPTISLPTFNNYYVGPVERSRTKTLQVKGKTVEYSSDPPTAKAVNLGYNIAYKTTMPVWMESLKPGSVLSYEGPAELIDPIDLVVKKVEDAKIASQTTVIDIDGGRVLPMTGESELEEPGMMLLYDENGSLKVTGEVEDQEMYRIYSFAEERGL